MVTVSIAHGETSVSFECDDDGYAPDMIDDMAKHAVRACYAAHMWCTGQSQPKP